MKIIISSNIVNRKRIEEAIKQAGFNYTYEKTNTQLGEEEGAIIDMEHSTDILKISSFLNKSEKDNIHINLVI